MTPLHHSGPGLGEAQVSLSPAFPIWVSLPFQSPTFGLSPQPSFSSSLVPLRLAGAVIQSDHSDQNGSPVTSLSARILADDVQGVEVLRSECAQQLV